MSSENYEPLSEELYWRKKIGDEIRESITRMREKQVVARGKKDRN